MNKRRLSFQNGLLDLMETANIDQIKVTDLTAHLNISRSKFYTYYDSIYAVLQEIEDEYIQGIQTLSVNLWYRPLSSVYFTEPHPELLKIMEYIYDQRRKLRILLREGSGSMLRIKSKKMVEKNMFPLSIMEMVFPTNTEIYVSFLAGGHLAMLFAWMDSDFSIPPDEFTMMIYRLMFSGIIYEKEHS